MADEPKSDLTKTLEELREAWRPIFDEQRRIEAAECPARLEKLAAMGVSIASAGGNCPVQIEGKVDGEEFYFRARGDVWSLGIGGEPVGTPDWEIKEDYGTWPDAGWMALHEAYDFLIAGCERWQKERKH